MRDGTYLTPIHLMTPTRVRHPSEAHAAPLTYQRWQVAGRNRREAIQAWYVDELAYGQWMLARDEPIVGGSTQEEGLVGVHRAASRLGPIQRAQNSARTSFQES